MKIYTPAQPPAVAWRPTLLAAPAAPDTPAAGMSIWTVRRAQPGMPALVPPSRLRGHSNKHATGCAWGAGQQPLPCTPRYRPRLIAHGPSPTLCAARARGRPYARLSGPDVAQPGHPAADAPSQLQTRRRADRRGPAAQDGCGGHLSRHLTSPGPLQRLPEPGAAAYSPPQHPMPASATPAPASPTGVWGSLDANPYTTGRGPAAAPQVATATGPSRQLAAVRDDDALRGAARGAAVALDLLHHRHGRVVAHLAKHHVLAVQPRGLRARRGRKGVFAGCGGVLSRRAAGVRSRCDGCVRLNTLCPAAGPRDLKRPLGARPSIRAPSLPRAAP